ncbi:zinc finger, CCHC-type containing protein [Tanacetum coccineum]
MLGGMLLVAIRPGVFTSQKLSLLLPRGRRFVYDVCMIDAKENEDMKWKMGNVLEQLANFTLAQPSTSSRIVRQVKKTRKQASMVHVVTKHDKPSSSASVREQGNISLQCPKLTETNYTTWALLMKTILKAHGLWKTIDTKDAIDEKKTHTSKAMIFQTLPKDVLMQVAQC